jgi:hypothetical protein
MDMEVKLVFEGDIEILEKYRERMFGEVGSEYYISSIMELEDEFKEILEQYIRMIRVGMDGSYISACLFCLLSRVLPDERLVKFRKDVGFICLSEALLRKLNELDIL